MSSKSYEDGDRMVVKKAEIDDRGGMMGRGSERASHKRCARACFSTYVCQALRVKYYVFPLFYSSTFPVDRVLSIINPQRNS